MPWETLRRGVDEEGEDLEGRVKRWSREGWQVEVPPPPALQVEEEQGEKEKEKEARILQARMRAGRLSPVGFNSRLRQGDLAVADVAYLCKETGTVLKQEVQFLDTNKCENCALPLPVPSSMH